MAVAGNGYRLPIAVLGVPIRGKRNPYLVLVSREPLVSVDVDVEEAAKPSVSVEGWPEPSWRLRLPLSSFVEVVSDRLEQPLRVSVTYRCGVGSVPTSSLYAVITLELVRAVAEAGGYEMTWEEVLRAAASIDADAGAELDYVNGMRRAVIEGRGIAYREGEDPVPVPVEAELELVGEEEVSGDLAEELGDELVNALTRFAGLAVATSIARLREGIGFSEVFRVGARIENALYYMLYGLAPPEEGCKWVPSLASGFAVCVAGRGLGERVAMG